MDKSQWLVGYVSACATAARIFGPRMAQKMLDAQHIARKDVADMDPAHLRAIWPDDTDLMPKPHLVDPQDSWQICQLTGVKWR